MWIRNTKSQNKISLDRIPTPPYPAAVNFFLTLPVILLLWIIRCTTSLSPPRLLFWLPPQSFPCLTRLCNFLHPPLTSRVSSLPWQALFWFSPPSFFLPSERLPLAVSKVLCGFHGVVRMRTHSPLMRATRFDVNVLYRDNKTTIFVSSLLFWVFFGSSEDILDQECLSKKVTTLARKQWKKM